MDKKLWGKFSIGCLWWWISNVTILCLLLMLSHSLNRMSLMVDVRCCNIVSCIDINSLLIQKPKGFAPNRIHSWKPCDKISPILFDRIIISYLKPLENTKNILTLSNYRSFNHVTSTNLHLFEVAADERRVWRLYSH